MSTTTYTREGDRNKLAIHSDTTGQPTVTWADIRRIEAWAREWREMTPTERENWRKVAQRRRRDATKADRGAGASR